MTVQFSHRVESDADISDLSSRESSGPSLLDRLKQPTASDLARKRRIPCNPPTGLKKGKGTVAAEPVKVEAFSRLKEFPDQCLSVVLGKLFCSACRENASLKKSVISLHLKSAKHASGMQRLKSMRKREQDIADLLTKYDNDKHPVGEKLPQNVRVYRIKVLTCFLKAGIPLNKVGCFREILEESSFRLTSGHHLAEMIPIVRCQEEEKIRSELHGRNVSVVFDGTAHVCEAMVVVLRFVNEQ